MTFTIHEILVIAEALESSKQVQEFAIDSRHATGEERALATKKLETIEALLERSFTLATG